LTGSPGSISILKKSKQRRFSKKKTKVNGLQPGFAGSTRRVSQVTPDHDFSYFFFNLTWFQQRIDPPDRTGFRNYATKFM
jgi:hypothetical protein